MCLLGGLMRKVKFFEYEQSPPILVCKGEALFHQWGVDYEEFETGPGNYSTAIIELPNGVVKNIPADQIEFIISLNKDALACDFCKPGEGASNCYKKCPECGRNLEQD
jgi:hypothetical protein